MSNKKIIVIDFGAKSAESIAEILEKDDIATEIVPHDTSTEAIRAKSLCGLILSGRDDNKTDALLLDNKIFEMKIPILGIAYGMQYIVRHFGGRLERKEAQECREEILHPDFEITNPQDYFVKLPPSHFCKYGKMPIWSADKENPRMSVKLKIFEKVEPSDTAIWFNHNGKVDKLPKNFEIIGKAKGEICVIVDFSRNIYALQFYPEAKQSKCGAQILNNFARFICGCE